MKEDDEEKKQLKAVYHELEEKMKQALGTKVIINFKDKNKGKIEIEYYKYVEVPLLIALYLLYFT